LLNIEKVGVKKTEGKSVLAGRKGVPGKIEIYAGRTYKTERDGGKGKEVGVI